MLNPTSYLSLYKGLYTYMHTYAQVIFSLISSLISPYSKTSFEGPKWGVFAREALFVNREDKNVYCRVHHTTSKRVKGPIPNYVRVIYVF